MKLYDKFIYFAFIYLIYLNKWVLVESTDTSATPPASSGGDTGTKTGVELSLKATSGTNEFDYKKSGNIVTYTANDDYCFNSVKSGKNGDIVVWKTDKETEYATKVVLNGKGKNKKTVTIHLPNNTTKVFKRENKNKPWNEVIQASDQTEGTKPASGGNSSGTKTGTGLNIDSQYGTDKFHCKKNGQKRTYTPKDNYAFKYVGFYIGRDAHFIWKASGDSDFSSKVEVDYTNNKPNKVTIHLKDNKTKVYNKGSGGKWTEDTDGSTHKSTTDGSGGGTTQTTPTSGGTTGTGASGGTDQSGGGTTGTDGSGGGGTQQSTPATQ